MFSPHIPSYASPFPSPEPGTNLILCVDVCITLAGQLKMIANVLKVFVV